MITWSNSYMNVKYLLKLWLWIFCNPRGMTLLTGRLREQTDSCKATEGSLFIKGQKNIKNNLKKCLVLLVSGFLLPRVWVGERTNLRTLISPWQQKTEITLTPSSDRWLIAQPSAIFQALKQYSCKEKASLYYLIGWAPGSWERAVLWRPFCQRKAELEPFGCSFIVWGKRARVLSIPALLEGKSGVSPGWRGWWVPYCMVLLTLDILEWFGLKGILKIISFHPQVDTFL